MLGLTPTENGGKMKMIGVSSDVVVVVLLFYVQGKHLRSCRDDQLT